MHWRPVVEGICVGLACMLIAGVTVAAFIGVWSWLNNSQGRKERK